MHKERGFLLMDLLVGMAVLAVVLPPLLGVFLSGSEILYRARRQTTAVYLAREALEEAVGAGYGAAAARPRAEVAGFAGFWRKLEVKPLTGEDKLKVLTVTVTWDERGAGQNLVLSTFLAAR